MISTRPAVHATHGSRAFSSVASLAFVLTGVVNTFLGPILPILSARWNLTDLQSGYFLAAQFLGSILGVSISSILLPRRGFRFSIGTAYLLMAFGVSALQSGQWKFAIAGTFVFGLGLGLVIPSSNLLISSLNQAHRAASLSMLNFCWGMGAVGAPVALALLERWDRVSAFVPGLSGLLLAASACVALTVAGKPAALEETAAEPRQRASIWPFAAVVGGMFFLYVGTEASIGGWMATLAERTAAPGSRHWTAAPSFFWGGLLAGRALVPFLLRRWRERNLAVAGLIVACAGMCLLVLASRLPGMAIAGFVAGSGLAPVFPITIALLSRFHAAEKQIAGPMFALAGLGGAVMPWLVGVVSTRVGSLRAGLMMPLLAAILLLALHFAGEKDDQKHAIR